jgi:predicted outer membrane protein
MSGRDLAFLTSAIDAARAQAYFIGLLRTKANSDQIKALAETLRSAQDEENTHLTKLAAQKGWNASMAPTGALKKAGAELEKLTGADFDKAALGKVAAASQDSVTAYKNALQSSDADIKSLSTEMLPLAEEKGHIIQKMSGANPKTESDVIHRGAGGAPAMPTAQPAGKPGASANPASAATAAQTISVVPIATPPSTGATRAVLSPILPSKTPMAAGLPVATPPPTATILVPQR